MRDFNRFFGCLLGGAMGDALGYEIEFMTLDEIQSRFGPGGITEYALHDGKALISDDTQMTLFTANGLLVGVADGMRRDPVSYIADSYLAWMKTQFGEDFGCHSWLNNIPELNHPRAPGNTCVQNLGTRNFGSVVAPRNFSKGCGGVMRVAPIGLFFQGMGLTVEQVDMIAADAAALTHGHELGYIPAAALAHIIYRIAHEQEPCLLDAVNDAIETMPTLFPEAQHMPEFTALMNRAVTYAQSDREDVSAIRDLGEGWVAEEALAIGVYCALKYEKDPKAALIAAVNHQGDSDSTGSITGNILGALLGASALPREFLSGLEALEVIRELAADLFHPNPDDPNWEGKYRTFTYVP